MRHLDSPWRSTPVSFSRFLVLLVLIVVAVVALQMRSAVSSLRPVTHLVIVPGHAVFNGTDPRAAGHWTTDAWLVSLLPHMLGHIKAALDVARKEHGLVVFSGGMTRKAAGRVSEGASYLRAAVLLGWVRTRVAVEPHARDSLENVLFSLCAFKQATGAYPRKLTVVGFSFKDARFVRSHFKAVRFANARYVGVGEELRARYGSMEHERTIPQFDTDPYGCRPPLSVKRAARNPWDEKHDYVRQCPEMAALLAWCGPGLFPGPLPWYSEQSG